MPLIAARTAKRSLLIAAVTFITTLLILAITWLPQFNPLVLVSILGVTTSGTFALALALPVLETDTPHEASQLSSMMSSFGYIIGGVTPALVGIGKDITGSYEWSFTFLAALSFCMVVIALFLPNVSKNHAT
jgi:CP family cyanate transporter-like MFS transporter